MREAYARVDDGEVWLFGVHIAPYARRHGAAGHDPDRRRKLLLHRREIGELDRRTQQERLTLVPLSIYFKDGRAKVELAVAGAGTATTSATPSPSATPTGTRPGPSGRRSGTGEGSGRMAEPWSPATTTASASHRNSRPAR